MAYNSNIDLGCNRASDFSLITQRKEGVVVSWLVCWSPHQTGRVKPLTGTLLCVDMTLYCHSASLHPGVQMGTGESNAAGVTLRWT